MKSKLNKNNIYRVDFVENGCTNIVFGFLIESRKDKIVIASTFGNEGFTDHSIISKPSIQKITSLKLNSFGSIHL